MLCAHEANNPANVRRVVSCHADRFFGNPNDQRAVGHREGPIRAVPQPPTKLTMTGRDVVPNYFEVTTQPTVKSGLDWPRLSRATSPVTGSSRRVVETLRRRMQSKCGSTRGRGQRGQFRPPEARAAPGPDDQEDRPSVRGRHPDRRGPGWPRARGARRWGR